MSNSKIAKRFRGFLPVVIDVETGGLNAAKDALLEIAAVIIHMDDEGRVYPGECDSYHVEAFPGANLDPEALAFNKIDPHHPFRFALSEKEALGSLFEPIRDAVKANACQRAVLVGHNAWFDLLFVKAAIERCKLKSPFHAFTSFDTATLAGLAYGETVLAKAAKAAGIKFDNDEAHSAIYDTQKTAELFCAIVNEWHGLKNLALPQD